MRLELCLLPLVLSSTYAWWSQLVWDVVMYGRMIWSPIFWGTVIQEDIVLFGMILGDVYDIGTSDLGGTRLSRPNTPVHAVTV